MKSRKKCGFTQSVKQSLGSFLTEGPYVVLERTSEVNYKVAKPSQMGKWGTLMEDAWNPKEKKRTTALRSEGFLKNPGVDQDEWQEEELDTRPTHQNARMRSIAQRRRLNERSDDNVPNLEELFHKKVVPEPDWIW